MSPSLPPPTVASLQPTLTPQFCFDTTAVRDFLRLSRATVDDSLSVHLNALLTPSRTNPFDSSSTSTRSSLPSTRRQIPADACATFKNAILFPSWKVRSDVLAYCNDVANAVDPNSTPTIPGPNVTSTEVLESPQAQKTSRNYWGRKQTVDERLDPYSGRDYSYVRETETEVLKQVLSNEEMVEKIVRTRTWGVLNERCIDGNAGVGGPDGWTKEWHKWSRA